MSVDNVSGAVVARKQYQETMPKLNLELNSRVLVNLNPSANQEKPVRLQGEFLGTSHYEFLIIRLPSIPGLISKLIPRMRIEASYQDKGAINRFISEVISHSVKPGLLLFVTYPDRMNVTETRKHQRVTCALPVSLATPHGDGIAAIRDLSKGGCRIILELTGQSVMRQVTSGDRIVLQASFSTDGTPARGIAIVRSVETTGSRLHMGVAFDEGHKAFNEALANYLDLVRVLD